ncbi:MAG: Crp/Fnr family transcriptional regulator [Maribacter sp.]|uniref:Crp/Fnr family transcriptional regulator n=1 Tax=Maribacter sp. TaxID=1897614 RepID=UPI0032980E27
MLHSSDRKYLASIFSVHTFAKKTLLQHQGQLCKKLFFVEEGSLRAFSVNEEGKEATIMFAVDDWWITDMYCFSKQLPAMVSLEALEDTKVVALNFEAFENLLARLPKFERFFRILFQNAYAREQLRALDSISLSTEERYRRFLIKYPQIVEKVTQKQIASYLGVTPEFLSSVKKK